MNNRISEAWMHAMIHPAVITILTVGNWGSFILLLLAILGYLPRQELLKVAGPTTFLASFFTILIFISSLFRRLR
jgi:hypothetical protein